MALRKVGKNESYSRKAEVKGKVVSFQHLTLHKKSNVHYLLDTAFDFTGVEEEKLLRLAGETLLIRWRTAFKDADAVDDNADKQTVKVSEMLAGRKPRMSKAEKVENLLEQMDPDEAAKMLAALQKKLKARGEAAKG